MSSVPYPFVDNVAAAPSDLQRGQSLRAMDADGAAAGHAPTFGSDDATWLAMGSKVEDLERYAGPALAGPIVAAWREMSSEHLRIVERLGWASSAAREADRQYANACRLVADMHAAAFGRVTGPVHHGVVEDVAALGDALRETCQALQHNPGDADPIDGLSLEDARVLLRQILNRSVLALDGPRPPAPPQPLPSEDVDPGAPVADALA